MGDPELAPAQVQSVDRALAVLDLLAQRGEVGVTDLAAELGVHKSTAFRLVTALERRQLVEQVGDRGKYRLGLGILRLAAADETLRKAVLTGPLERYTEQTVTDPVELRRQLDEALTRGWAGTNEELEVGLTAIAAPIRGGSGRVVAAISVSGPSYRLTAQSFPPVAVRLIQGAGEISARLGFHG
jgi:DNA-binding IclR family transcriptional regulator